MPIRLISVRLTGRRLIPFRKFLAAEPVFSPPLLSAVIMRNPEIEGSSIMWLIRPRLALSAHCRSSRKSTAGEPYCASIPAKRENHIMNLLRDSMGPASGAGRGFPVISFSSGITSVIIDTLGSSASRNLAFHSPSSFSPSEKMRRTMAVKASPSAR